MEVNGEDLQLHTVYKILYFYKSPVIFSGIEFGDTT